MLKVAVIGPGNIAHTYMHALSDSKTVKVSAVLGINEEQTKSFAEKYSINYYIDADVMYNAENIDAVIICTPTFTHENMVKKAIENRVHIMCEKPFVLDYDTAHQLFDMADKNNVRIMVMQVVRFWPEYVQIKRLVDSGELGDVINVYVHRLSAHPDWCSWHKDPKKSGGGLYDLHIHDIDYMYHLFGKVNSVYAVGKQTESGCWNNVSTILNFACGVSAVVEGFMDITGKWDFCTNVRINGSKAAVEYISKAVAGDDGEKKKINNFTVYPSGSQPQITDIQKYNPYKMQTEYFAQCVRQGKDNNIIPRTDVEYVLKIISAIEKSLITGKVQTTD